MSSWQSVAAAKIKEAKKTAILGVGSELKTDDAAGMLLIEALAARNLPEQVLLLPGSTAPENFTGVIRAFAPDLLILIDAAQMEAAAGAIAVIDAADLDGLSFSTHMLPLSVMLRYLQQQGLPDLLLLGIQPESTEFGFCLTPPVAVAVAGMTDFFAAQFDR